MQEKKKKFNLAILSVLILILGMYLGFKFNEEIRGVGFRSKASSIEQIMRLIEKKYVDTVDLKQIEQQTIEELLSQLDPHSVYIPAEDIEKANEQLEG
ncbi:MAG: peptidase S41, partial [bacterium]